MDLRFDALSKKLEIRNTIRSSIVKLGYNRNEIRDTIELIEFFLDSVKVSNPNIEFTISRWRAQSDRGPKIIILNLSPNSTDIYDQINEKFSSILRDIDISPVYSEDQLISYKMTIETLCSDREDVKSSKDSKSRDKRKSFRIMQHNIMEGDTETTTQLLPGSQIEYIFHSEIEYRQIRAKLRNKMRASKISPSKISNLLEALDIITEVIYVSHPVGIFRLIRIDSGIEVVIIPNLVLITIPEIFDELKLKITNLVNSFEYRKIEDDVEGYELVLKQLNFENPIESNPLPGLINNEEIIWQSSRKEQMKLGESVNGDITFWAEKSQMILAAVIDGVGHGINAGKASHSAFNLLKENISTSLVELIPKLHNQLKDTSGIQGFFLQIDKQTNIAQYIAIGNVEATLIQRNEIQIIEYKEGILGRIMPNFEMENLPINEKWILVVHSDGISSKWRGEINDIRDQDANSIMNKIFENYGRKQDDSSILVIKNY